MKMGQYMEWKQDKKLEWEWDSKQSGIGNETEEERGQKLN